MLDTVICGQGVCNKRSFWSCSSITWIPKHSHPFPSSKKLLDVSARFLYFAHEYNNDKRAAVVVKVDTDNSLNGFHIQLEDVLHSYISLINELVEKTSMSNNFNFLTILTHT